MESKLLINLNELKPNFHMGNKARNLLNLKRIRKTNIPNTWVLSWDLHRRYQSQDLTILDLVEILQEALDENNVYAVRSSSNIEDSHLMSFAGLFKTRLSVQGYQNLSRAVIEVWDSIYSRGVKKYADLNAITPEEIRMSVIIQEMVTPIYSGVLFSRNPMTGAHEIVIECVEGEGTALVQDGVTPERWVSRFGGWVAQPENYIIPESVIDKVLRESGKIIKRYKHPIDLEWVYDGCDVYWVQMREITTIKNLDVYSNRLSKDMMPGMIHPLIWSINVPMINGVWLGLLEEIVGKLDLEPEDLAKSFYFRSYFNMGKIGEVFTKVGFPSEGLEMMMGILPKKKGRSSFRPTFKMIRFLPNILAFLISKWRFEKKIITELPEIEKELSGYTCSPKPHSGLDEMVDDVHKLMNTTKRIVYFNIVTPLLVSMYVRLLEQQLKKFDIDMTEINLSSNFPALEKYDPNKHLAHLNDKFLSFNADEKALYDQLDLESLQNKKDRTEFDESLLIFVKQFGHFSSNSNNFMSIPWRENLSFVIDMIKTHEDVSHKDIEKTRLVDIEFTGIRKHIINFLYHRFRKFILYRERISSKYIYGYGLFRPYIFRIAEWMINQEWISERNDIFFLSWEEIRDALLDKESSNLKTKINERKKQMEDYKEIELPDVIFGDDAPPIFPKSVKRLSGTATSSGYYSGPVKVVRHQADFEKVEKGDVIVIPYSDVGWTPLFTRAGAVISESGGMLSHSSIIAREYQIPAIVSVPHAMQLVDNQYVSINGFTGEIIIIDDFREDTEEGD